jgi:two-component system phosphate regulon sensor histidine kinase PhoR
MLSRIELKTNPEKIGLIKVKMNEVLESAALTCQPKAVGKRISIKIDCDDKMYVKINPNLIEEAVINLVTNAVTYSPEQSNVTITAALSSQDTQKDNLVVSIEDQGIGIENKHLERLFERFYRTDKARSSAHGGTGLARIFHR